MNRLANSMSSFFKSPVFKTSFLNVCLIFLHRYIRNGVPLETMELRSRYPPVDAMGRKKPRGDVKDMAGLVGE